MSAGKLGRLPAVRDPRTLRLSEYTAQLPSPPPGVHRSQIARWPMLANDRIGDCTIAAAGHMVELWDAEAHKPDPGISDIEVVGAYSAVSGYDPSSGANDNGAVELDVLNYWCKTGIAGNTLGAFAGVDHSNARSVREAIWLFGGCYIGLSLPVSAQAQTGQVWDTPAGGLTGDGAPGSWGGHAVPCVSYDGKRLACVTWGTTQLMTWRFFGAYCEEAYALLDGAMLASGKGPQGFNLQQLQADLAAIKA